VSAASGFSWRWSAILALLTLLLALPTRAAPPIPPAPDQWVTDRAAVMSEPARASLNRRLSAYEQQSGHQIIVFIDHSTGGAPIEDFAVKAFEQWKIGRAKLDDGLGIFVMTEDRALRIEVGYGLEPIITDLFASQVIRNVMIPAIQRGEWDAAIVGGVEALVDEIEGQPGSLPADPQGETVEEPQDPRARIAKIVIISVLAIGFLILLIVNPQLALMLLFLGLRGSSGGGGGGGGFGGGGGRSGGGGATGRW
jgi:uncharacterized protein